MQHKRLRTAGETEPPRRLAVVMDGAQSSIWVDEAEVSASSHLVSREAVPDQGKRLTADSHKENVEACPGVDSTRITALWRRAIAWAMARPNPVLP